MMTFIRSILVALLLIIAAPAYSESSSLAVQVFTCEFGEDTLEEQVLEMAAVWLKAAKGMPGGKNMEVAVRFPIAEGPQAEGDFVFYFITPTFAEWGTFTDAYEGSAASEVDDQFEDLVECGDSTIWEGHRIK
jgi:hypothetical protein